MSLDYGYYDDSDVESDAGSSESDELDSLISHHISTTVACGAFATHGIINDFVLPGIFVEHVGNIRLPLSHDDAQSLIRASRQAPFGKGGETIVDTSIRNTWELGDSAVRFLNPKWEDCLHRVVAKVAGELGIVGGTTVRAEFHKMLLYEAGAMFKDHQDTEKAIGMVGTLVVCLPSEHRGGNVQLRHGSQTKEFDTSETSAFGATYLAWYADVQHEIRPVESGYRSVLTYNLIASPDCSDYSAQEITARLEDLTHLLARWEEYPVRRQFMVYPLAHQYTNGGLKTALLKGQDAHRARHVLRGCQEQGDFYMFPRNMELIVVDPNDEAEDEEDWERELFLCHVVDPLGFELVQAGSLPIDESTLLLDIYDQGRGPDNKRGGGYLGNQHAEIDQVYKDSCLIIVRRTDISKFLLGGLDGGNKSSSLRQLVERLRFRGERTPAYPTSQELLLQICNEILGTSKCGDSYLGIVAETAAFVGDSGLFSRAVGRLGNAFDDMSYYGLGKLVSSQEPKIAEDELIHALSKSENFYQIHSALEHFRKGFLAGNADAKDPYRKTYMTNWSDDVLVKCLEVQETFSPPDYSILVSIIKNQAESNFRRVFLYQAVRKLVDSKLDRPSSQPLCSTRLLLERCVDLRETNTSNTNVLAILQRISPSAVTNFSLCEYTDRLSSRTKTCKGQSSQDYEKDPAAPLEEFFSHIDKQDQHALLARIDSQCSELPEKWFKTFAIPFCRRLTSFLSSPQCHQRIQTLLDQYIRRTVGPEPEQPTDWKRPEETASKVSHSPKCGCVEKINAFLLDPNAASLDIYCHANLSWFFDRFAYFEVCCGEDGAITITKTSKSWEKRHTSWEKRASEAVSAVRTLAEPVLKEVLADQYDAIMELRNVRNVVAARSGLAGSGSIQPKSVAGRKRLHAEASSSPDALQDELALDYRLMGCRPVSRLL